LINPFGGAGAAPGNWATARQLFELAQQRIELTVVETERANHAFEYVQQLQVG
jgi:diacylglycerol kinase family enzyme